MILLERSLNVSMDTPENSAKASGCRPTRCEISYKATVIRLIDATNSGSHGISSVLEDPAARTAMSRKMRAAAAVNGPNLARVNNHNLSSQGVPSPVT
jgi:hypothetical protein